MQAISSDITSTAGATASASLGALGRGSAQAGSNQLENDQPSFDVVFEQSDVGIDADRNESVGTAEEQDQNEHAMKWSGGGTEPDDADAEFHAGPANAKLSTPSSDTDFTGADSSFGATAEDTDLEATSRSLPHSPADTGHPVDGHNAEAAGREIGTNVTGAQRRMTQEDVHPRNVSVTSWQSNGITGPSTPNRHPPTHQSSFSRTETAHQEGSARFPSEMSSSGSTSNAGLQLSNVTSHPEVDHSGRLEKSLTQFRPGLADRPRIERDVSHYVTGRNIQVAARGKGAELQSSGALPVQPDLAGKGDEAGITRPAIRKVVINDAAKEAVQQLSTAGHLEPSGRSRNHINPAVPVSQSPATAPTSFAVNITQTSGAINSYDHKPSILDVSHDLLPATPVEAGSPQSTGTTPHVSRTDLLPQLTRQLADVVQHMPQRPVEITLSPEELGRVRLSVSAADAAVTVTILAERPETLDLMRRNIDQLTRDFQQMGYDSITFSFGERQGDGNEQGHSGAFAKDEAANNASNDTASPASLSQAPLQATSGLDLRM